MTLFPYTTLFRSLTETSTILRNCTNKSLVIIDELGRGTSTHDGVAIAYATLYTLIKEKKCMVIFVTHYPKILDIIKEFKGEVGAYHVAFLTDEKTERNVEEVTFLYKVIKGASDKSFGLNVARLAQVCVFLISLGKFYFGEFHIYLSKTSKLRIPPSKIHNIIFTLLNL